MPWQRFEDTPGPVLHLGCGGSLFSVIEPCDKHGKWINVDIDIDERVWEMHPRAHEELNGFKRVVRADVRALPFPDDFADGLYSNHTLEHIPYKDTEATLKEWRRVIRPGCAIIIQVPDLLEICKKLVEVGGKTDWSAMGERTGDWENGYSKLIGGIYGEPHTSVPQTHKNGFTPLSMRMALEAAGFRDIQIKQTWWMEIFNLEATALK